MRCGSRRRGRRGPRRRSSTRERPAVSVARAMRSSSASAARATRTTTATMSAVPPPAPSTASAAPPARAMTPARPRAPYVGRWASAIRRPAPAPSSRMPRNTMALGHRSAARSRDRPPTAHLDCRACPPRSCRPRAGRCSATATASSSAPAPSRACAAPGARASAWWRSRWRSRPRWTPPRWRSPRGARARTGSASSTPIAIASRWPRSVARPRSTTAAPGASGASPRAGAGWWPTRRGRTAARWPSEASPSRPTAARRRSGPASSPRRCTCPRWRWRAAASG